MTNIKGKLTKRSKGTLQSEGFGGDVLEVAPTKDWNGKVPLTQFGLQRSGTNFTRLLLMVTV